jgi:hypothetical protein
MVLLVLAAALAVTGTASARGGHYVFDGGTPAQQSQVVQALVASSFDWSVVPATITIRIAPGIASEASPGYIDLDSDLLDAGIFSWGVVQHEYAHQVDFFLLDASKRAFLARRLGGAAWWEDAAQAAQSPNGTLAHGAQTGERFASTLAWSYWPSRLNSMRPTSRKDESAAMAPAAFRALLPRLLAG